MVLFNEAKAENSYYSVDLFLNNFFSFDEMPVLGTSSQRQEPVIERSRFIAAGLGHAAQAFGPTNSVFNLHPAAGVGRILD